MTERHICAANANKAGFLANELTRLSAVARRAASAGGEELMRHYGQLEMVNNKGRAGDLVTSADLAAERVVLELLSAATPEIGILAEESGMQQGDTELCWCVDPLDGTTNFAHGYPFFACSVGLTWKNKPVLGAVAVPFLKELFWASPGEGAFCNNQPIQVSFCTSLLDSLLVTGFAYDRHTRLENNYAEFCWLTHRTRGVRRGGAAAVDLAFVAAGRLDGYWEHGLSAWDLAAGVALVDIAGGTITSLDGSTFDLGEGCIVAGSAPLHRCLLNELHQVIPLPGTTFGAPELDSMGS